MSIEKGNLPKVDSPLSMPESEERTWAALAHASSVLNLLTGVGGIIAALIIWVTQKDKSRWVAFHALQAMIFQVGAIVLLFIIIVIVGAIWLFEFLASFSTFGIVIIIVVPMMIITLGLGMLAGFFCLGCTLFYSLYGAYKIYNNEEFRYPWIADFVEKQTGTN